MERKGRESRGKACVTTSQCGVGELDLEAWKWEWKWKDAHHMYVCTYNVHAYVLMHTCAYCV